VLKEALHYKDLLERGDEPVYFFNIVSRARNVVSFLARPIFPRTFLVRETG
jgi:hypothetical protein